MENKQALAIAEEKKTELARIETQKQALAFYSKRSTGNKIALIDCLEEQNLVKLTRDCGPVAVEGAIILLIAQKMELFNVRFRLNDTQIEFLVDCFLQDYKSETLADLGLCLNNAAKGKYGTIYNAIDPPTVLSWFRTHLDEKSQAREQQKKAAIFDQDTHPKILEVMKGALTEGQEKREEGKGNRANNRDQYIKNVKKHLEKYDQRTLETFRQEFITLNYERFYPGIIAEIEQYIN